MLEKEYEYYLKHKNSLIEKYVGKYIIIKNNDVIGAYESKEDAIKQTQIKHKIGTFLIQLCSKKEEDDVMRFHSRVAFSSNAKTL